MTRPCARGCVKRGIHFASCDSADEITSCRGCAPADAREGSLICGTCFARARQMLDDLPDLVARLRAIADPSKATPSDKPPRGGGNPEPTVPVGSDVMDAILACERVARDWGEWVDHLPEASNRLDCMPMFAALLDRHEPDKHGIRAAWSVMDAWKQWGPERRPGRNEKAWSEEPNSDTIEPGPDEPGVPERDEDGPDPLLNRLEAGILAGSARTLRRWIQEERIAPRADITIAGVRTLLFRTSDVLRVKREAAEAEARGVSLPDPWPPETVG